MPARDQMQNFAIRWGASCSHRPGPRSTARLRDRLLDRSGVLDWLQRAQSRFRPAAGGAFATVPDPPSPPPLRRFALPAAGDRGPSTIGLGPDGRCVGLTRSQCAPACGGTPRALTSRRSWFAAMRLLRPFAPRPLRLRLRRRRRRPGPRQPPPAAVGAGLRSAAIASRWRRRHDRLLGATGTIGRHVAADLAERGADARAVVRDPSRSDLPLPADARRPPRPQSLRAAFDGAERLLLLTPHGPDQDLHEAAAVEAAVAAGVQRIVKISGGAPSLGPNGPSRTAVGALAHRAADRGVGLAVRFLRRASSCRTCCAAARPAAAARADGPRADSHGRRARRRRLRGRGPDGE